MLRERRAAAAKRAEAVRLRESGAALRAAAREWVCTRCLHRGPGTMRARGSFAVEVVLWLLFCFPGAIYSVWRLCSRRRVCRQCQSEELVPSGSARGLALAGKGGAS